MRGIKNLLAAVVFCHSLHAAPVVYWASDSLAPGDAVLLYGNGLAQVATVQAWQVTDSPDLPPLSGTALPAAPADAARLRTLQPNACALKFILPDNFQPGVYAVRIGDGSPVILNRPTLWFLQPEHLQPGLRQSQSPAGALVQIVGKDLLLPGEIGKPRIILRPATGGDWREITPSSAEKFSLHATLPGDLKPGPYEMRVSTGYGGAYGWSAAMPFEIRQPDRWPDKVFNVKSFGAKGDDVTDDTAAIRSALDAARANGGGVVYFPWGTYRLSDWICIPGRTAMVGDERDATVLKWPITEPAALTDFTPCAVYGDGSYRVENLTFIARRVDSIFLDLSTGQAPPELKSHVPSPLAGSHDIFLRHVAFQHWLLCGHPDRNAELWVKKYPKDVFGYKCFGVTNFEVSDCQFQGAYNVFGGIRNARILNNSFSNDMGYSWTCFGSGAHYVVADNNDAHASTSWGYGVIGMKYVLSEHNRSHNFVRGEREAMTLDISATPAYPHGGRISNGNVAWFGSPKAVDGTRLTIDGIKAEPNEYVDMCVMILDGPGAGQYREITGNMASDFTVDHPWDVSPDTTSTIGIWQLMRHMAVYKCEGYDTSAFAQLYGSFYDYIVDSCTVLRNQGVWGQSGWFVQFRYNHVAYAFTFHKGIGPHGPTPEGNLPWSWVGLTDGNLRITKFGSSQYGVPAGKAIFVKDVVAHPVPGARGCIVKGNTLEYGQRVAFRPGEDPMRQMKPPYFPMMTDMVVDRNKISHSAVGIYAGFGVENVLASNNEFSDVANLVEARPGVIESLGDKVEKAPGKTP